MRIALVAEDYYPQLGGVPEHVHNLALQLNSWGHPTTVVTSNMGDYPDAPFVRRVGTSRVIYSNGGVSRVTTGWRLRRRLEARSEEHTSELQSRLHLVCRLLLEKKKNNNSRVRSQEEMMSKQR